jgi:hypothetical protein
VSAVSGLPWAVVRVHRTALIVWGAFVAAVVGALLWAVGVKGDAARAEEAYCRHHDLCTIDASLDYSTVLRLTANLLCYSFYAVAAWAGAALIARELETGTARLAWTQSVSPARWLAAKLAVPALIVMAGGAVLVSVYRWGWSARPERTLGYWTASSVFVARGPAVVAYALCALAVGALAGLALRRSLPALGVSLAVMLVIGQCLDRFRADLWPAVTRTGGTTGFDLPEGVWQLENGALIHGTHVPNISPARCPGNATQTRECLADQGITGWYSVYHPASQYWPLHLVETGIVLSAAVAATTAAFWLLRRRTG